MKSTPASTFGRISVTAGFRLQLARPRLPRQRPDLLVRRRHETGSGLPRGLAAGSGLPRSVALGGSGLPRALPRRAETSA
jgi:hypothetical protein